MGVKGLKMAQNHKKLCLLCFISQESHIIWLPFMVHMSKMMISSGVFLKFIQKFLVHLCKMMISPSIFFIFSKFWFFWFLVGGEVKGQKMTHNYHFQSVTLRTVDHIMKIIGTQVSNNDISRCFSLFLLLLLLLLFYFCKY